MYKFVLTLLAATVICILVTVYMLSVRPSFIVQTSTFLFLTTIIIYRYLSRQNNPQIFVQFYLAIMGFKLMAYGGYIFAIVILDRTGAMENAAYFLSTYALFTALELGFLYEKIRGKT